MASQEWIDRHVGKLWANAGRLSISADEDGRLHYPLEPEPPEVPRREPRPAPVGPPPEAAPPEAVPAEAPAEDESSSSEEEEES